jgi:hypothetical protein
MLAVAAGFPPGYRAVRSDADDEGREGTDATLAARLILPGIGASYLMPTHSPIVSR